VVTGRRLVNASRSYTPNRVGSHAAIGVDVNAHHVEAVIGLADQMFYEVRSSSDVQRTP
jgi:hypothetical protein